MVEFLEIDAKARQMLAAGAAAPAILTYIVSSTEAVIGNGCAVSIMLLDESGLLRNSASPSLPLDYLSAIDGIKPDASVGTCAAAAATGQVVLTPDFCADEKWAELKHLPLSIGFHGAWSMPIKTTEGKVLGTFGTYYPDIRKPSAREISGVELLANTVAAILAC